MRVIFAAIQTALTRIFVTDRPGEPGLVQIISKFLRPIDLNVLEIPSLRLRRWRRRWVRFGKCLRWWGLHRLPGR